MRRFPERIGDDVQRELKRFGPVGAMAEIVKAWPAAVGDSIARNAWPARVSRDGTLHVATSSSAWAFELGHLEPELRARLGKLAPPRLRFAAGPLPEGHKSDSKTRKPPPPKPTPAEWAEAERIGARIEAEELRNLVTRAAAASLANARSDRSF